MGFSKKTTSIFSLLKQALNGSEQNFTEGSIDRAIFLLSVPMVLEMAMEALFAVVDALFVSRLHDNDAIATVGLTESVLAIVYSLGMGLSMGATALVARRIGEKRSGWSRGRGSAVAVHWPVNNRSDNDRWCFLLTRHSSGDGRK